MGAIQRSTKTQGVLAFNSNQFQASVNGNVSDLVPSSDWGTNHLENETDGILLSYYLNSSTSG
jgi:hypothetical protein